MPKSLISLDDATAALVRMDGCSALIQVAMTGPIGGYNERERAAHELHRLAERLSDLARRIHPTESGDYAHALGADGHLKAIQIRG